MDTTRAWTTLTPLDGSVVGGWLAETVGLFGRGEQSLPRGYPAYAVVHQAPSDDYPIDEDDVDLPLDAVYDALRDVLARHTTSERCVCAQWEGFGYFGGGYRSVGVVSPLPGGDMPLAYRDEPPGPGWEPDPGSFGAEANDAPRMVLPFRDHVLFDGVLDDLRELPVDPGDDSGCVPSVFWPEDRAWVAATDVDDWVTTIAGTEALVADLLADDRLRVDRVSPGRTRPWSWTPVGERF